VKAVETSRSRGGFAFLLVFLLLAAGIVTTGWFYYRNYEQHYRTEMERQLSAIADLKVSELVQWRKERLADGSILLKNAAFVALARRFFEKPEDADAQRQLQSWIEKYEDHYKYDQVRLLDAQGIARMSSPAVLPPMPSVVSQRIPEVLRSGQVTLQGFYRNEHDQHVYLTVMVPILDESDANRPLAVLVLRIDPEMYLYPFIKRWPTPSLTAETLLVRREGNEVVFLNELRFQTNTALNLRLPLDRLASPAAQAALGRDGVMEGLDYRGRRVVAALRTIPGSPWALVARMDAAEVYAPLRAQLWQVVVIIGLLLLGAGAGVGLVWWRQRVRLYWERYESVEALRTSAVRYRRLFEAARDGILILDAETGMVVDVNPFLVELLGYSRDVLLGKKLWELGSFKDIVANQAHFAELQQKEYIRYEDKPLETSDGRRIEVEFVSYVYQVNHQRVIQCNIRDITQRKRADESLSASEVRYRRLFETAKDGILVLDAETGMVVDVNPFLVELLGYSRDVFLGKKVWELGSFKDIVANQAHFTKLQQKGYVRYEDRPLETSDGRRVEVEFVSNVYLVNHHKVIQCNIRDITERKRTEEQLKASFKEISDLKAALDEHAIVATTDAQGKITYVNDKFCTISRYSREELLGQDHRILNSGHHPKEFIRNLWTTITDGRVWHGEIKNRAKDGSYYWVDATIVPFLNEQGKPRQYVAIRTDITARKHAEEQVRELNTKLEQRVVARTAELAAVNKELEAFCYSVSHDLRAPLRGLDGFSQALLEDYGDKLGDDGQHLLQRIRAGSQRMGQLIDDLLNLSRVSRSELRREPVNLSSLAGDIVEELRSHDPHRDVALRIADNLTADGDPQFLRVVLENLLGNAWKYTAKQPHATIEFGLDCDNGQPSFFVRDDGVGFDMQYVDKLFTPFQRLHAVNEFPGTGIGLATVQRIVHRHGGRVWAEAEVNKGATFHFTLP